MAKHAYHFKHDFNAHNDEKILDLRMDLGMEGYGVYWYLVELLAQSDGYKLNTNYKRLAFSMQIDEKILKAVVEDYGLFCIEKELFFSKSLIERMIRLDEIKRKRAEIGAKGGKSKAIGKQLVSKTEPIAKQNQAEESKGEESKVKKRREEDNKEKKKIITELFVSWWGFYDKKLDRKKSEILWNRLTDGARAKCLEVVHEYVKSTPNPTYRKHPTSYLNGECWDNEILPDNVNKTNFQKPSYQKQIETSIDTSFDISRQILTGEIQIEGVL